VGAHDTRVACGRYRIGRWFTAKGRRYGQGWRPDAPTDSGVETVTNITDSGSPSRVR